jgi:phage/plasmid primase-like uncharacterized protein
MPYKSYSEQIREHLIFLKSNHFDITELEVNGDFVRSHQAGQCRSRGELAYKTRAMKLNNGLTGLQTWFRGPQGETCSFQTYGLGPSENEEIIHVEALVEANQKNTLKHDATGRKAYGFWQHSSIHGKSEYLERKQVGCYGIRFRRSEQYGDVAVIPMVDELGRLWNYQLLNPNGSKRQPKDARTEGLFHVIGTPTNGQLLGIAESYVTSASCFELTGIPTVCAFSCQNLKNIAVMLRKRYPESLLVIFADNDRHLEERGGTNQGLVKGLEALNGLDGKAIMVAPDFGDSVASKGLSDWNDLINQKGFEYAKIQINMKIQKTEKQERPEESGIL